MTLYTFLLLYSTYCVRGACAATDWKSVECVPTQVLANCSRKRCGIGHHCALSKVGIFGHPLPSSLPSLENGVPPYCSYAEGKLTDSLWTTDCKQLIYSPGELRLLLTDRRVLFHGDSMVRQIFNRLIIQIRGGEISVDPWYHVRCLPSCFINNSFDFTK